MPNTSHHTYYKPPEAPITCYCGVVYATSQLRGYHIRVCPIYKTFTPEQKQEHKDRVLLLNNLRQGNSWKDRFRICMDQLLKKPAKSW